MFALLFIAIQIIITNIQLKEFMLYFYLVIMLMFVYLFIRSSLVFPSIAVDGKIRLRDSWEITRNNQLLMLSVILIIPLFIGVFIFFLGFNFFPIEQLINLMVFVFEVALLSVTYKYLVKLKVVEA